MESPAKIGLAYKETFLYTSLLFISSLPKGPFAPHSKEPFSTVMLPS